jgi:hypothetical protein
VFHAGYEELGYEEFELLELAVVLVQWGFLFAVFSFQVLLPVSYVGR